jgi:hypothetical protein
MAVYLRFTYRFHVFFNRIRNTTMKKGMKYLVMVPGVALLLAACSTTARLSSSGPGAAFDDLYATHDRQAYREAEIRQTEALKKLREQRALEDIAAAGTDGYYSENILSDSYEESYERRLRGFSSLSYNLPGSYYNLMYSEKAFQASAYDPAFYNVILMGDEVWVEPRYITSMFGSWGTSVNLNLGWGWNRWYRPYWDWYHNPGWAWNRPSWGWGYDPYWGWGGYYGGFGWGYYPPYYSDYWGWGGHGPWGHPHWGDSHWSGSRYDGRTVVSGAGRRPSLSGSSGGTRYGSAPTSGGASNRRGASTMTRPGTVYYNNNSTTSTQSGTTYRRGNSTDSGSSYGTSSGTRNSGYSGSSSGASSNRRGSGASSPDSRSNGSSYSVPSSSGSSSSRRSSSGSSYSAPSSSGSSYSGGGGGGYSGGGGSSSSSGGSSSRR